MKTGEQKQRYFALDRIRAIALLNMIAYHTIWDLVYLFGFGWKWFQSECSLHLATGNLLDIHISIGFLPIFR